MSKKKPFRKVCGSRVLIERPLPIDEKTAGGVILAGNDLKQAEAEAMDRWTKLTVFAVGESVDDLKEGDQVYLPISAIKMSDVIVFDKKEYMIVRRDAIAIIY